MSPHGPTHQSCCNLFFNSLLNIHPPLRFCFTLSLLQAAHTRWSGNNKQSKAIAPIHLPLWASPSAWAHGHQFTTVSHHNHFQSTPCRQEDRCSEAMSDHAHSARICTQNLNSCALSDTCPFASQEAQLATLVFVVGCSQLMSQTLQVLVFWAGREALSPSTEF